MFFEDFPGRGSPPFFVRFFAFVLGFGSISAIIRGFTHLVYAKTKKKGSLNEIFSLSCLIFA